MATRADEEASQIASVVEEREKGRAEARLLTSHIPEREIFIRRFTEGEIVRSGKLSALDLAIDGGGYNEDKGFFCVDDQGKRFYTRAGAFHINRFGFITDEYRRGLIGFLTDELSNITGAQGPLAITNSRIEPKATSFIDGSFNLDACEVPPSAPFATNFSPERPPATNTFNKSASMQIYDSLGTEHIMTWYFVKAPAVRTWYVYVGIDGVDATSQAAIVPPGGTSALPVGYGGGQLARPFTLVFDQTGRFVVNNVASRARHYGNPPVTSVDSTNVLVPTGSLPTLDIGDLTINGVPISVGSITDTVSTAARAASMISIRDAINARTALHKVTASVNPTILVFTGGTYTTDALAAGNLTINGTQIIGAPAAATPEGLAALIMTANVPGVVASVVGGQLRLIAVDGRNIEVETNGTATTMNFTNFATAGLGALSMVKRGQISLTIPYNQGITIGGNAPGNVGLMAGTQCGIFQDNSDAMRITFAPGTGAASPQTVDINLSTSTQFASPFTITSLTQDGYATGRLVGVEVNQEGIFTGRFSNGKSQQLGQVMLADVKDKSRLKPAPYNAWQETEDSGVAISGAPGTGSFGLIISHALEDIRHLGYSPFPFAETRVDLEQVQVLQFSGSATKLRPYVADSSSVVVLKKEAAPTSVNLGELPKAKPL